jgi:YjbE family integral membrane protein
MCYASEQMTSNLAIVWGIVQIFWINIMLSGDNAIMIALACRALPDRQRRLGILFGASGAVALRIAFTLVTTRLLGVPLLTLAGGLFVVVLAAKLPNNRTDPVEVDAHRTLMSAVFSIVAADAVMSLDNVLALAAAAKGSVRLIVFGLLLSAPIVMFGASILATVMSRLPILIWVGAMILGWAGGVLIAGDSGWSLLPPTFKPPESLAGALGSATVLLAAFISARRSPKCSRQRGRADP